ncbi:UNVERIFIED_ORG: DNA invertase Pin-like site-specific DNA recombinase [Arthrobacter globiformis]|nr:DNA invertase Pin-like site-specific DNA recombinase [Arthrobacter globiformis]
MSGNVIGYARVSTRGQSLDSQVDALVCAGAVRVFQEYASGATQARMRWKECLDYLQPGNVLMVADLTRLGRSTADLADIVTVLGQRGIGFRSLAEPWLDTTSAHGTHLSSGQAVLSVLNTLISDAQNASRGWSRIKPPWWS